MPSHRINILLHTSAGSGWGALTRARVRSPEHGCTFYGFPPSDLCPLIGGGGALIQRTSGHFDQYNVVAWTLLALMQESIVVI